MLGTWWPRCVRAHCRIFFSISLFFVWSSWFLASSLASLSLCWSSLAWNLAIWMSLLASNSSFSFLLLWACSLSILSQSRNCIPTITVCADSFGSNQHSLTTLFYLLRGRERWGLTRDSQSAVCVSSHALSSSWIVHRWCPFQSVWERLPSWADAHAIAWSRCLHHLPKN